jgi:hypothetical protein
MNIISVADPHHFDAVPDPACLFDADPDPSCQKKIPKLEKVLKKAHIPYVLGCRLQMDADFDSDPAINLMRIRIQLFTSTKIHADPDPQH